MIVRKNEIVPERLDFRMIVVQDRPVIARVLKWKQGEIPRSIRVIEIDLR